MKIPAQGVVGVEALREAATTELRQIIQLVQEAINKAVNANRAPNQCTIWVSLEALFPSKAIVSQEGRYYAWPFSIDDKNQVQLGAAEEVIESYVPVSMREAAASAFTEAVDGKGFVWEAVLVKSGLSLNSRFYSDAVLREAAPLFEGRPVFAKADEQHLKGEGKDVRNILGYVGNVRFVEGATPDTGALTGTVTLLAAAGSLPEVIREAWDRGKKDLVGLSIDAVGRAKSETRGGKAVRVATKITKVNSVDLIVEPGAGGGLVRLLEAADPATHEENSDMKLKERMLEAIKAKNPARAASINLETVSDEDLETAYREALAAPAPAQVGATAAEVAEQIRMVEARANARATISTAKLPQAARDKLLAEFGARERFTEADVDAAIKGERDYLAKFTESGKVSLGDLDIEITEPRSQKIGEMLNAFFDPAHKDHRQVQSFRECYIDITGDRRVTGRLENCDPVRLREALGESFRESLDSTSWANVLGSAITRRLVADYRTQNQYDIWRPLANVVPVNDFRTQERVRFGGYGDLPAVNQGAGYNALTSPSDEKASYAVTKRGGTEDVTLEMIKNDDVGAIRQIPTKLSRAAKRTLAKFVLDFLRTNPTIYDTVALYHATHNNLGAAALDATTLAAGRLAMLKQAEAGSSNRLGIGPKFLVVPLDLQETAVNLFNRNTNLDKTFIQETSLQVIPVWYWTDANDWRLVADPLDIPTIEVGFLDGNEEPELFVQDAPNVGSMFSNDKLTYKIRHIYGGAIPDFRGHYGAVVA